MNIRSYLACLIITIGLHTSQTYATEDELLLRLGIGTDIELGVAVGIGVSKLWSSDADGAWEVSADFYIHNSEEDTTEFHTYHEETELTFFTIRFNRLFDYDPYTDNSFRIAGIGAIAASMEWSESSPTDTSLGTPCCGGGSQQSDDGFVTGLVLDIGFGKTYESGSEMRLEVPVLIFFSPAGDAASFVPTVTLSYGKYF